MKKQWLRKIGLILLSVFVLSLLVFVMSRLAPGDPHKILKICEVLKVTPYELLGENETERNAGNPEMSAGNETEKIILEGFRNLSDRKKERILGYLAALQED